MTDWSATKKRPNASPAPVGPAETRIALRATSGSTPIARRTWLTLTFPEEHAAPDETATTLYERIAAAHVELVREYVPQLVAGTAPRIAQDPRRASAWPKRTPADGIIDWETRAPYLHDWVRAQTRPYPGAFTYLGLEFLHILRAEPAPDAPDYTGRVPGRVVLVDRSGAGWVDVLTGDGVLRIHEVSLSGGDAVPASTVIASVKTTLGLRTADLLKRLQSHGLPD